MKAQHLHIVLVAAVMLCLSVPASGEVFNIYPGGDRVVYDNHSRVYWYPFLTASTGLDRAGQEDFIDVLNTVGGYAGITAWEMATWEQTTTLKYSLASMGTLLPTRFDILGQEDDMPDQRGYSSPYLAWEVNSLEFFTPTGFIPYAFFAPPDIAPLIGPLQVFNGRTTG
ncbi:MAG: hypothetical protein ACYSUX_15150, partial [Planctomycetota bacterium]